MITKFQVVIDLIYNIGYNLVMEKRLMSIILALSLGLGGCAQGEGGDKYSGIWPVNIKPNELYEACKRVTWPRLIIVNGEIDAQVTNTGFYFSVRIPYPEATGGPVAIIDMADPRAYWNMGSVAAFSPLSNRDRNYPGVSKAVSEFDSETCVLIRHSNN